MMKHIIISGSFDNLQSEQVLFLDEAARLGAVHVLLWSDETVHRIIGAAPMFLQDERKYFVDSIRYVQQVTVIDDLYSADGLLPARIPPNTTWVVPEREHNLAKQAFCQSAGLDYQIIPEGQLKKHAFFEDREISNRSERKKVIVTGCYDWLHTGHIRFFEEVSQLGDLYVVVGSDENVRLLKGEGHPFFRQDERRYMVQAVRYVTQALISTGEGWMDASLEIERIRPDIYAVNEDGDKPEKRAFCAEHGIQYAVLKRMPKEGLPRRESTKLRGF
jgi:cytidyltransferase-like protein